MPTPLSIVTSWLQNSEQNSDDSLVWKNRSTSLWRVDDVRMVRDDLAGSSRVKSFSTGIYYRQPQFAFIEDRNHLVAEVDFILIEQVEALVIRNDSENDPASHPFSDK
jgi:hypothetical protein